MPCDSIITTQIDLSKANEEILIKALQSLGLRVTTSINQIFASGAGMTVMWRKGEGATVKSYAKGLANDIAPAYSKIALETVAKKNGWQWKQIKENVFDVIKR